MRWLWLFEGALGATLSGVEMPDTARVGDEDLVLVGMGLERKLFFDVYVGGLYLQARPTTEAEAVEPDVAKRLALRFLMSVPRARLAGVFAERMASGSPSLFERVDRFAASLPDVRAGDDLVLDYVPGRGTEVRWNAVVTGAPLPGADFMRALWGVFIGDAPASEGLERGLLGR